jgi:radical SAM superfamily enzyme
MEEYVATVVEALQMTGPAVVIQRLTADASPPRLVAPAWVRDKTSVLKAIDEKLIQLDARQGDEWDNGTART